MSGYRPAEEVRPEQPSKWAITELWAGKHDPKDMSRPHAQNALTSIERQLESVTPGDYLEYLQHWQAVFREKVRPPPLAQNPKGHLRRERNR